MRPGQPRRSHNPPHRRCRTPTVAWKPHGRGSARCWFRSTSLTLRTAVHTTSLATPDCVPDVAVTTTFGAGLYAGAR
jgi:hypothetical protein